MNLVIGATAHFGRQAVEELVGAGAPVRALTRTPERPGSRRRSMSSGAM
jgi:uncharacterized protein YbjT (DUF2867 family)